MSEIQIQLYIALLDAAAQVSVKIYNIVKDTIASELSPDENAQVLAQWRDNRRRAAANAGIIEPAGG